MLMGNEYFSKDRPMVNESYKSELQKKIDQRLKGPSEKKKIQIRKKNKKK